MTYDNERAAFTIEVIEKNIQGAVEKCRLDRSSFLEINYSGLLKKKFQLGTIWTSLKENVFIITRVKR